MNIPERGMQRIPKLLIAVRRDATTKVTISPNVLVKQHQLPSNSKGTITHGRLLKKEILVSVK